MNTLHESCHTRINRISLPSETASRLFFYVQWAGHFVCKPDFYICRSRFESYLLLYTVSGEGILHYEGHEYRLPAGSAALIDCTRLHEYHPDGDVWEFRYVHFHGASSDLLYEHITELHGSHVICDVPDICGHFERILSLVTESADEVLCSEEIYSLLCRLIRAVGEKKTQASDSRVRSALTWIANNYSRPISVSELAEAANLSRCHFSVEFKKHTGFSPYQYILSCRIAAARRLLDETNKTLDEISAQCGFCDTTTFIRAFCRVTGHSPSAYRKRQN